MSLIPVGLFALNLSRISRLNWCDTTLIRLLTPPLGNRVLLCGPEVPPTLVRCVPLDFVFWSFQCSNLVTVSRGIQRTDCLLGWDPIFEYEGQTYAEMDKEAKVSLHSSLTPHFPPKIPGPLPRVSATWHHDSLVDARMINPPTSGHANLGIRIKSPIDTRRWSSSSSGWQRVSSEHGARRNSTVA